LIAGCWRSQRVGRFSRWFFTQNWICSPKIPLRKKLLGSTYAFEVVIFDPSQVFLAVILARACWVTVNANGRMAMHVGYTHWLQGLKMLR
jgi:hypothetical protein